MTLTIPIDAIPHKETAFGKRAYTPAAIRNYKEAFALIASSQVRGQEKFTGAVRMELRIYRNKKSATARNFGDVDNLVKPILDAITMTGAVWKDDSQVVDLHVVKATAQEPHVEITIEEAC